MTPMTVDANNILNYSKGFLEVRSGTAQVFEFFESSRSAKLGLGIAIENCLEERLEKSFKSIKDLLDTLFSELKSIPGIVIGEKVVRTGIFTFKVLDIESNTIVAEMLKRNIKISVIDNRLSVGSNMNVGNVIRVSVNRYNTQEEIGNLVNCLKSLLN